MNNDTIIMLLFLVVLVLLVVISILISVICRYLIITKSQHKQIYLQERTIENANDYIKQCEAGQVELLKKLEKINLSEDKALFLLEEINNSECWR